jgi:hypothetical protein
MSILGSLLVPILLNHPVKVVYGDSLLDSAYPNRPTLLAVASSMRAADTLIILARDSLLHWPESKRQSLLEHETFHFVKLHPSADPYREALANWYSFRKGYTPLDPANALEWGYAASWYTPYPDLLYGWWHTLAHMPDTTILSWFQDGTPIPDSTFQQALLKTAHCFAGDSSSCPGATPRKPPKSAPAPKSPKPRSLHPLTTKKCPQDLPKGMLCVDAMTPNHNAISWKP